MRLSFTSKKEESNRRRFHKNLFLDELDVLTDDEDFNDEEEEIDNKSLYQHEIDKKSNIYRLKHLPTPLTSTIAEVVQELSNEKFILDDLSFIFELSRKRAISPYAIILALIYMKRLKKSPNFSSTNMNITSLSNTEFCLISILLASKYLVDEGECEEIYNDEWADASDLTISKINSLEKSVLNQMDWRLYVSNNEFWEFTNNLTQSITRKKIKLQLGNCTYSDLDVLLSNSSTFSINSIKNQVYFLTKLAFILSSTAIYLAFSSIVIASTLIHLKSHLMTTTTSSKLSQFNQTSTTAATSAKINESIYSIPEQTFIQEESLQIEEENTKLGVQNRTSCTFKLNGIELMLLVNNNHIQSVESFKPYDLVNDLKFNYLVNNINNHEKMNIFNRRELYLKH